MDKRELKLFKEAFEAESSQATDTAFPGKALTGEKPGPLTNDTAADVCARLPDILIAGGVTPEVVEILRRSIFSGESSDVKVAESALLQLPNSSS